MSTTSEFSGDLAFTVTVLLLALLIAAGCYLRTTVSSRRAGKYPWGIHPVVWSVLGFIFGLIGLALALIASATNKARPMSEIPPRYPGPNPYWGPAPPHQSEGPVQETRGWVPSPPEQATDPLQTGHLDTDHLDQTPLGPIGPIGGVPPAGWYPDPARRHHFRLWDGGDWTDYVSDDGIVSNEPLGPPPVQVPSDK